MRNFEKNLQDRIQSKRKGNAPEVFEFFWETRSPFSQWHKCSFQAIPLFALPGFDEPVKFTSAEQFMMLHKALAFDDRKTAESIINTDNVREQKSLGRSVANFDAQEWDALKVKIVYEGNKHKFTQSNSLRDALVATQGKTLVEAAPDDAIWGIGLHRSDVNASSRETWKGTNFLGEILTALRIELTGEY